MSDQSFAPAHRATQTGMYLFAKRSHCILADAIAVVHMAANQGFIGVVEEWLEADGALKV